MEKRINSDTIYIRNVASNNSSKKVIHKNIEDTNIFSQKYNIIINSSINVVSLNNNRGHNIIQELPVHFEPPVGVDLRVLIYGAHLFLN